MRFSQRESLPFSERRCKGRGFYVRLLGRFVRQMSDMSDNKKSDSKMSRFSVKKMVYCFFLRSLLRFLCSEFSSTNHPNSFVNRWHKSRRVCSIQYLLNSASKHLRSSIYRRTSLYLPSCGIPNIDAASASVAAATDEVFGLGIVEEKMLMIRGEPEPAAVERIRSMRLATSGLSIVRWTCFFWISHVVSEFKRLILYTRTSIHWWDACVVFLMGVF